MLTHPRAERRQQEQTLLKARLKRLSADDPLHDEVFAHLVTVHELDRAEAMAELAKLSPAALWDRIELARAMIRHHLGDADPRGREILGALAGIAPADLGDQIVAGLADRSTER